MVATCGARSVKVAIAGSADQWYGTSSCLAVVVSSAQEYVVTALRLHVVLCTDQNLIFGSPDMGRFKESSLSLSGDTSHHSLLGKTIK